jgi:hypothetical protein
MAKKAASLPPPKIYQADAPANANGAVYYFGVELTVEQAIAHRKSGGNVVVRGSDKKENLRKGITNRDILLSVGDAKPPAGNVAARGR